MQEYLHLFETAAAEQAAYTGSTYVEPWVSCVRGATGATFNKPTPPGPVYNVTAYRAQDNGSNYGSPATFTFTATSEYINTDFGDPYVIIPSAFTRLYTWVHQNYAWSNVGNRPNMSSGTDSAVIMGNEIAFSQNYITGSTVYVFVQAAPEYEWQDDTVIAKP